MLSKLNNQKGSVEVAILVSIVAWLLTIGVVNSVKKERQPAVQVQEQQAIITEKEVEK